MAGGGIQKFDDLRRDSVIAAIHTMSAILRHRQLNTSISDTFICVPEMGSYAAMYAKTQLPSDSYNAAVGPWQARYGHNSTDGS